MEPLYTTQFAYTFEEYKKFNIAVLKSQKLIGTLHFLFIILSVALGTIDYFFINKNIIISLILTPLFIILMFTIFPIAMNKAIKKIYYSNKTLDKNISNYEFFENEIKETDLHSINIHKYSELVKVIETKTNFYLMIDNAQGYIIIKNNCSPELIAFLSELKNKIN